MNVYDFDKTIYAGDSSVDLYLFCLRKQPGIWRCTFRQAWGFFLYALGRLDKTALKERFFSFLPQLKDTGALLDEFWAVHEKKLQPWYLRQKAETDVVISASPDFLLTPICARLGIQPPIATQMDPASGKITGQNCKGQEKVRRFFARYPAGEIERFYSDSLTDTPLADMAREALLVRGTTLEPWPLLRPEDGGTSGSA